MLIAYSCSETWSWDVRTKHVNSEPIPTVEGATAIANYGPNATLFTKGPNHTIQQYDMNPPALVKQVQYMPMLPPPIPTKTSHGTPSIPGTAPPMMIQAGADEVGGPVSLSTIQRTTGEMQAIEDARHDRSGLSSPVSSRSRTESISSRSSNPYQYERRRNASVISSRAASGTTFSTVSPSMVGRDSMFSGGSSIFPKTSSMASSGRRSKGSRLRQEVIMSPEHTYVDLFPRTRVRLSNVSTFQQPQPLDQDNLSPDDLRRRMLAIVFRWDDDIEPLIRDELAYHKPGSTSAVLLSKWLGDVDSDMMAAMISSGSVNSSDWMLLALSQMGAQGPGLGKMGQAFVQRLLSQGDFHTSATILLGLGDLEDAVEVYVSRSFFMEAILLTCVVFPTDWQRQAHLVRRWGEFVVENSQQHLAMRCFTCTGIEPPIPWASPSMQGQSTPSQAPSGISSMLSPPVSPPPGLRPFNSVRMTTKNSALKVITSFAPPENLQHKFPGPKTDDRTPTNAPGVTPIAESAISPGGATPGGFLRPSSRGSNAPGRTNASGALHRNRLPSIGETPIDVAAPSFPRPSALPTPNDSGSDKEKENQLRERRRDEVAFQDNPSTATLLLFSACYDPGSAKPGKSPITAFPDEDLPTAVMPHPPSEPFETFREKSRARQGSRDRKLGGLHIHMPHQSQIQTTCVTASRPGSSADHRRSQSNSLPLQSGGLSTGRSDLRSDTRSPPLTGSSYASTKSPSVSGRSLDQYISSLEEAGYRQRKNKSTTPRENRSRESRSGNRERKSRSKPRLRDVSDDRGRNNQRYIRPAKRSPSSPVPMSPEDLELYKNTNESTESLEAQWMGTRSPGGESRHGREQDSPKGASKLRSGSKASDFSSHTVRRISPDGNLESQLGSEASYIGKRRVSSRRASPIGLLDRSGRGRSKSKTAGSVGRSPSSPLPMSPQSKYYRESDDENDPSKLVEANRRRLRSRQRSSSRQARERGMSSRRDRSPDRRRLQDYRYTRLSENDDSTHQQESAVEPRISSNDIFAMGADQSTASGERMERAAKKQLAARELEARRISLAQRTDAPPIHPAELQAGRPPLGTRSQTDLSNFPISGMNPASWQQRNQIYPSTTTGTNLSDFENRAASVGPYGLPATPRAMRHPRYDLREDSRIPAVPEVPDNLEKLNETYYTGQPMVELPRSMSAPIPQQPQHIPDDLPMHPAFRRGLRPTKKGSTFSPLGDIGAHRRRPSVDATSMVHVPVTAGIDETLHAAESAVQIVTVDEPPLLPELQHLAGLGAVPPPPPPPPPFHNDGSHHSVSSGSGVGTINIAIDDQPGSDVNVIEVPPPPPPPPQAPAVMHAARSPPPMTQRSPPPNHRRGRSDNLKNGIKGFTERLRSTSRGRNNPRSPPEVTNTPSPYESVPPLYF